jgi:hypothetical protein
MANNLGAPKEHKTNIEQHHAKSNGIKMIFVAAHCALLGLPLAQATVIDFEDLADSDSVTTQYADVTSQNTMALTAGASLNDSESLPKSGVNVVFDYGGPIIISFINPMISVSGFFTCQ